jgi:uncharacterized coiled-coil protein SlyX
MQDLRRLHDRIERISQLAGRPAAAPGVIAELNDVLSEGYAEALLAEERLIRLEERLADGIESTGPNRAEDVRRLATEYRTTTRQVAELRALLAALHERFLALQGAADSS